MINVGLLGTGRIGKLHANNLVRRIHNADLIAAADVDADAVEQVTQLYGIPHSSTDPISVIHHPEVDAVIICSSTDSHADLIIEAAGAGKHIFCEKPVALDVTEIKRALEAVDRAGVALQIGFNRRFDPNFRHIRESIRAGKIGTPHLVRITSRDPAPPPLSYLERSGGIFLDMTIHDFDMARFLIDQEIVEVYATGGVRIDPAIASVDDLDTAIVVLTYADGTICTIDNSRQAVYGYDQRVEVFGSDGILFARNNRPHNVVHGHAEGIETAKPHYFFLERYTEAYVLEMEAFIDAVISGGSVPVTGLDGLIPVLIGRAAWTSYHERRPVRLDEGESLSGLL